MLKGQLTKEVKDGMSAYSPCCVTGGRRKTPSHVPVGMATRQTTSGFRFIRCNKPHCGNNGAVSRIMGDRVAPLQRAKRTESSPSEIC
ncbi:hypothetical protein CDAR_475691 [Caerostris darwini]|uniref:Zinc finger GRF-type domain-containing protein n=1 Tax=Caerostris darwini TaxID=1538125 RepID=A0AAV4P812_9ARAC|nr:hypothetical protein CDAR_475691 [Caerostris darwini]